MKKLISWNVNGIRAALNKDFAAFFDAEKADIFCLQETKAQEEQVDLSWLDPSYSHFWNSAEKKGYSGTAVFTREAPLNVTRGINAAEHDNEGRVLNLEYQDFHLVNVYTPNAQNELKRLDYRLEWDRLFLRHLRKLEKTKPVIFCGDLNVAHTEIDLTNPKSNRKNPGFTDEERAGFDAILGAGFIDTFREFEQGPGHYTWWSYRANARANNVGWRIDYWCLSPSLRSRLASSRIRPEIMGSDHCPVVIEIT